MLKMKYYIHIHSYNDKMFYSYSPYLLCLVLLLLNLKPFKRTFSLLKIKKDNQNKI